MSPPIQIRPATLADAEHINQLGRKTFIDTFAADNTAENMRLFLEKTYGPGVQAALIADPKWKNLLAWIGTEPVGFAQMQMGFIEPCVKGPQPVELARFYVDNAWHGKGVAATMMQACLELSRDLGFQTLWLGVWERNFRAQAFYRKWQFREVGEHIFPVGEDPQRDLVMERKI